jgi:benzoyl-CoA reductase/2-hydroxyglutaryl-CoA dehydratase subunit BcrC/BadD/HgdB
MNGLVHLCKSYPVHMCSFTTNSSDVMLSDTIITVNNYVGLSSYCRDNHLLNRYVNIYCSCAEYTDELRFEELKTTACNTHTSLCRSCLF